MVIRNFAAMTEAERVNDMVRFIRATVTQETRLATLAHLDDGMRLAVLKKLGAITAPDVFTVTKPKQEDLQG